MQTPRDEAVCVVAAWTSSCSACGGNADPDEAAHIHGGPGATHLGAMKGCGAPWLRRVGAYIGVEDSGLNWTDMSKPFQPEPMGMPPGD